MIVRVTSAPSPLDTDAAGRVRRCFLDAGFTADGLLGLLGASAYAALARGEHVPARRALDGSTGTDAALARVFVLGEQLPLDAAALSLPLEDLTALGLLEVGAHVRAAVDVRPYGESDTDWYVVSDHGPDSAGGGAAEVAADHVLGVGGASLTLARITPRTPVGRALDLGTGCGVQALHLARHTGTVVATDSNERALRLAAITAALSGQDWDLRHGSLFEPVAHETFDLVVSNPPFVISPGRRYTYRDAGLRGDELGRILVQQAPERLADGGTAVVLANWLHVQGEDWRERVAGWVAATGCDAWVAQREVQDPAEYAGLWLRDAGGAEGPAYDARYGAWLDELAGMRAEGIGFGWVVLHRGGTYGASGPRIEDVASGPRQPRGDEVAGLVAARAGWSDLDAIRLLSSTPRRATGLRLLAEERVVAGAGLAVLPERLGLVDGWRTDVLLDVLAQQLVRSFDGATTLVEASERAAVVLDLEPDDVLAVTLVTVRAWVEDGLLDIHIS